VCNLGWGARLVCAQTRGRACVRSALADYDVRASAGVCLLTHTRPARHTAFGSLLCKENSHANRRDPTLSGLVSAFPSKEAASILVGGLEFVSRQKGVVVVAVVVVKS
jgi:hypothetical protein